MDENNPVSLTETDGKPVLVLQGAVDIFAAQEMAHAARGLLDGGEEVLIDCENLRYLDCAGLQLLLALKQALSARGKRMRVVGKSAHAERLFSWAAFM